MTGPQVTWTLIALCILLDFLRQSGGVAFNVRKICSSHLRPDLLVQEEYRTLLKLKPVPFPYRNINCEDFQRAI